MILSDTLIIYRFHLVMANKLHLLNNKVSAANEAFSFFFIVFLISFLTLSLIIFAFLSSKMISFRDNFFHHSFIRCFSLSI